MGKLAITSWKVRWLNYDCGMNANRFFPKDNSAGLMPKHGRIAWLKGGQAHCEMSPRQPLGKAWRIVLLGAPGAGEGTPAEIYQRTRLRALTR